MNIPYRPVVLGVISIAFSALLLERAQAGGGHFYLPVTDPVVKTECGSCHIAFSPSMLPAKSWQDMMGTLKNHFGDDASVDAGAASHITRYLVANAADSGNGGRGEKLVRGAAVTNPPLRITELPNWVRKHRKVPAWEWVHKDVRTRANCAACHADAERGYYDN